MRALRRFRLALVVEAVRPAGGRQPGQYKYEGVALSYPNIDLFVNVECKRCWPATVRPFEGIELAFPPEIGRKKQFELLGNSLSVTVVAHLLRFLLAVESPAPAAEVAEAAAGAAET